MDQGSDGKFEEIFQKNHKMLCGIAYNLTADADTAKDIVQDVFFKLWWRRHEVVMGEAISGYLVQAVMHASYNHIKQKQLRTRVLAGLDWLVKPSTSENGSSDFNELELAARKAVDSLPPKCKAIFLLSRQEGMKYQEIAEHLHISVKTVEKQMGIALRKLRSELKPFLTREFISPAAATLLIYLLMKIILPGLYGSSLTNLF
jgi:RNA polymerase sigma-70 factor (ECF subfamily)